MNWQVASFAVLSLTLAVGFAWYERSRPPAKVLSLVAALAALATVGRIAFAPIPNVKPTTDIAFFAGYALGPVPGFAVGSTAALASNVFFGQGPWTPWQMVGWGAAGLLGGLVGRTFGQDLGRWPLAGFCALAGVMFGLLLDCYQWVQGAEQDLAHYLAISATSLPYNVAHVLGNIGFCLLLGPTFVRSLARYRRRFTVSWAVPLVALAFVLAVASPPVAQASPGAAVSYLRSAQNPDGGFGGGKGQASTSLHTGWVALGLAAAGVNPADVSSGGSSVIDYFRAHVAGLSDIGELERTVLALDASGVDARSFAGRDLVAAITRRRSANGSWRGNNGWTAFGVLALKATGGSGLKHSARWLARQQNRDGGFGFRPGAVSDVDDTGAALQALAAAGMRGSGSARRALGFLRRAQNSNGGFSLLRGQESNAQSTSWAVQGIVAVGRSPGSFKRHGRTPLRFLRGLQSADGSVRYSRSSSQTPVWVTAQALDAFEQKPFPLAPAPRAARPHAAPPASTPAPGGGPKEKQPGKAAAKPPGPARSKPGGGPATPAPPVVPAPATPAGPSGPTGASGSAAPPAGTTDARRTASQAMDRLAGGSGSPWVPVLVVAGVAALAAWRIARSRRTA